MWKRIRPPEQFALWSIERPVVGTRFIASAAERPQSPRRSTITEATLERWRGLAVCAALGQIRAARALALAQPQHPLGRATEDCFRLRGRQPGLLHVLDAVPEAIAHGIREVGAEQQAVGT